MNPLPEGMAAFLAGVPYTVSVRGEVAKGLSARLTFLERPFSWLERFVLRHARAVLANGRDTQERLAGASIASTVVPNGVDFKRFSEPAAGNGLARELAHRAAGRPVIAFIATMDEIHGVADAIECARHLRERGTDFMMAMVGKGDTRWLERRVESSGLTGVVEFMGETSSVAEVLQRSSIFLGLSRGDVGMSMSALEAMAAGVPMVARDSAAYRQLIDNRQSGLLASTPAELAECCCGCWATPSQGALWDAKRRERRANSTGDASPTSSSPRWVRRSGCPSPHGAIPLWPRRLPPPRGRPGSRTRGSDRFSNTVNRQVHGR